MHKTISKHMKSLIHHYFHDGVDRFDSSLTVLDVGSYNVNGSLKDIMPEAWKYIGLDIVPGPGVDVVMTDFTKFPVPSESVDLVVSVSCFQYVENPFRLMGQLYDCVKPGGMIFICASHNEKTGLIGLPRHLCPRNDESFDCWRIKKYGMLALFEEAGFNPIKAYYKGSSCWGVGVKTNAL
jgi:SAM-dependent methyltransferase